VEVKKELGKKKLPILISLLILFSILCNSPFLPKLFTPAEGINGNISDAWHNTSQLTVSVVALRPQIVWYDFQYWNYSNGWESRLNQQIDVNDSAKYRFVINVTSYQGWDDIEYINITSWYDQGDETSYYNQTLGGNFNLFLQYENTTGNANYSIIWPNNESSIGLNCNERVVVNAFTDWPFAESRNISIEFIPSYQFRYAPGPDGGWDNTRGELVCTNQQYLNNQFSWNFNISATDSGENNSNISKTGWVLDEFGVYSYSEIISAGDPIIYGEPTNQNYSVIDQDGSGNVTVITRSNGNYTLSSNLSDLVHTNNAGYTISNESVSLRGGNRTIFENFSKSSSSHPVYLYGGGSDGMPTYQPAEANGTNKTTDNVEYRCFIPIGQEPGSYTSTIYYHIKTYR
jgi:hypothetical protein